MNAKLTMTVLMISIAKTKSVETLVIVSYAAIELSVKRKLTKPHVTVPLGCKVIL